jgi:UDP-2,4-diacetamido-2,4,6-trideoxy-beta-L-altropyranose hydrolase
MKRKTPPVADRGNRQIPVSSNAPDQIISGAGRERPIICFRADASSAIGSGHITRCLVLAERLAGSGHPIFFISRHLPAVLCSRLGKAGFTVLNLPPDTMNGVSFQERDAEQTLELAKQNLGGQEAILVVDHYLLDAFWEQRMRSRFRRILVIDDLADRPHAGDFLLDVTWGREIEKRYNGLIPPACKSFLGPRFALLREEFFQARTVIGKHSGAIKQVLVFFGGADHTQESEKILEAIKDPAFTEIEFNLVTGGLNPRSGAIFAQAWPQPQVKVFREYSPMALLMAQCDLAIGAGGSSSWERCFLALPTIVISTAPNQETIARNLHQAGAIWYLGRSEEVSATMVNAKLKELLNSPETVRQVSLQAERIIVSASGPGMDELLTLLTS